MNHNSENEILNKKKNSEASRTDLSEIEQQQFDKLFQQFELNFNNQKDGLNSIKEEIVKSTKMVTLDFLNKSNNIKF